MSIVTLCPQCKTAFAIQAEHYSAADAWVRCGRCAHVFEVDQHLFEIDPVATEQAPHNEEPPAALPLVSSEAKPTLSGISPAWQSPAKPQAVVSVLVAVVAACLLMGQVLLFHRDKMVAMNLSVGPVFKAVCLHLGCTVEWPKETDKVALDSINFRQLDANRFSFTLSVKNQAAYYLGTPTLELTLTNDEQGDVVRKVWFPNEMNLPAVLKPLRSQSVEMIFLVDESLAGKINGYRALLFYP